MSLFFISTTVWLQFNGKLLQAPAPLKIINNRFMVPAEFCAAKLGAEAYFSVKRNTLMVFTPSNGKITYEVISGDTLWIISQLFGTTVDTLKRQNGLTTDNINVGQKLVVKLTTAANTVLPAYTTAGATIRSGAGTGFSVVGYLAAWAAVNVLGKNGDWYKVSTSKGNGYIYQTVIGMKQELAFNPVKSSWFDKPVPVGHIDGYSYLHIVHCSQRRLYLVAFTKIRDSRL